MKQVLTRFEDGLLEALDELAARENRSRNGQIRHLVEQAVREEKRRRAAEAAAK